MLVLLALWDLLRLCTLLETTLFSSSYHMVIEGQPFPILRPYFCYFLSSLAIVDWSKSAILTQAGLFPRLEDIESQYIENR